ncbi:hypothetical protein [Sandaracinus amylolyticus]|uniref:Lipoprotein n=1 Tax=Sandaracinus amylolyticus TaxID=927083 RepID=A0A0F6W7T2_9BACT|nr:hypothetical protein [Sandaracinus amylolyticus]AKF09477.1 hypothetical protein DB32_006626 [Sandaracinus amylolyticus]
MTRGRVRTHRIAAVIIVASVSACGAESRTADAGRERRWVADCIEVGDETNYRPVCRDGDVIAVLCESDGGALVVCESTGTSAVERGLEVVLPRCPSRPVCTEQSASGPRLDAPVCVDGSEPSCEL